MYIHKYGCIQKCLVHTSVCAGVIYMNTDMCINIQAHIVTGVNAWGMHRCMQVVYMYTCVYKGMYLCAHKCICRGMYICMHIHTGIGMCALCICTWFIYIDLYKCI